MRVFIVCAIVITLIFFAAALALRPDAGLADCAAVRSSCSIIAATAKPGLRQPMLRLRSARTLKSNAGAAINASAMTALPPATGDVTP